jgi:hypothetical protein
MSLLLFFAGLPLLDRPDGAVFGSNCVPFYRALLGEAASGRGRSTFFF